MTFTRSRAARARRNVGRMAGSASGSATPRTTCCSASSSVSSSVRTDDETLLEALQHVVRGVAEPLADPAILPTFLLARAARERVKVILSGEGADELFGGYPTYLGHKIAPLYHALPSFARAALRRMVQRVPSSTKKMTLEFLLKRFVSDA